MEVEIEKAISELYRKVILQGAALRLLTIAFIDYASAENKEKGEALQKYFDENLPRCIESEVLSLQSLKDESLEKMAKEFIKNFPGN